MDKLIEYCQARYNAELEYKFSLSNIICWALFIITLHSFYQLKIPTLIHGINTINMKLVTDLDTGILPTITISQLILSFLFVATITWLSRKFSEGLFYLFCLKSDFGQLIIDITLTFMKKDISISNSDLENKALPTLEKNQKKLKQTKSISEITLAISACSLSGLEFNLTNIGTALAGLIIFAIITWRSFHFFIEEVLPYFVAVNYSTGKLTELKSSFSSSS